MDGDYASAVHVGSMVRRRQIPVRLNDGAACALQAQVKGPARYEFALRDNRRAATGTTAAVLITASVAVMNATGLSGVA